MKMQHLIGALALIIVQSCTAQAATAPASAPSTQRNPSAELALLRQQTREIRARIKALHAAQKDAKALQALDKARAARDKAADDLLKAGGTL